jgi:putative acetyltransferase
MNEKLTIRETTQDDVASLKTLYCEAFDEEDLFPLVTELLDDTQNTLHLTAVMNNKPVGHITFTKCHALPEYVPLSLLGPMAVLPECQKQGIGSKLITAGFEQLKIQEIAKVLVLGDPSFYGRSGFVQESNIEPAYAIPSEWKPAWQSILLSDGALAISGRLQVTKPWQKPKLWSE